MNSIKLAIDLGGTNIRIARVENGQCTDYQSVPCPANEEASVVVDHLSQLIEGLIDERVKGIGIGVPSIVDAQAGIVYDVANIAVNRRSLIITPMVYGSMTATVTGTDALGESVSSTFGIVVRDGSQPVDVYPNPVSDTLYVRAGTDSQGHVRIVSSSGATVYEGDVSVSVFSPAAVDMSGLPGGVYTVTVSCEGNETVRNIVKL